MLATKLEPAQGTINTVLFNMGQFFHSNCIVFTDAYLAQLGSMSKTILLFAHIAGFS